MRRRPAAFALAREALLNLASSPVRSSLTVIISAVVGAAVVGATIGNVDAIVEAHKAQELRGLATLSITALDGDFLSASACDSINGIDAVNSAGGSIRVEHVQPPNGAAPVTVRYVTPGYIAVAFPGTDTRGLGSLAGGDLAEELGIVSGAVLSDVSTRGSGAAILIDAVASSRARLDGMNRDVLVASAPVGGVSECLVDVSDGQADLVATVVSAFFAPTVVVSPFLPSNRVDRNPALELDTRWSGLLWLGGGLGIILFVFFVWWSRRHETALYRLLGFDSGSIAVVVALEATLVTLVPAQLAASWVLGLMPIEGGAVTLAAVAADTSRLSLLLLISPVIAIGISLTGSTVDRLKGQ